MKKRLIALMLSLTIGSTIAMTGCSDDHERTKNFDKVSNVNFEGLDDVYVVLEQNDKHVLHFGDLAPLGYYDYGYGKGDDVKYTFECGEEVVSSEPYSAYKTQPKAERYDEVCEDCMSKIEV